MQTIKEREEARDKKIDKFIHVMIIIITAYFLIPLLKIILL